MVILSQGDPRWAHVKIGETIHTMEKYGCTTTCISMASDFFEKYINPGKMAKTLQYTMDARVFWKSVKNAKMQFIVRKYQEDRNVIDEAIKNPKKVCILNVNNGKHWVLAIKRIFGGRYWVADPACGSKKLYAGVVGYAILRDDK